MLQTFMCNLFFVFSFLLGKYIPRSEIVGSYDNSMLNPLKNCQIVFWTGAPFYIPTSSAWKSQFLHIQFINTSYYLIFIIEILVWSGYLIVV